MRLSDYSFKATCKCKKCNHYIRDCSNCGCGICVGEWVFCIKGKHYCDDCGETFYKEFKEKELKP